MKIANSRYYGVLAASVAGALLLAALPPAHAQTVLATATAMSATTQAAAASPMPMPPPGGVTAGNAALLANPPAGPGVGQPPVGVKNVPAALAADADDDHRKMPSQVKDVVKKLQDAKVDLSLEDMNQARAALARLDLLLELEQKMGDLDKVRAKRAGADMADEVSAMLPRGVAHMPSRGGVMPVDMSAPVVTPVVMRAPVAGSYTVQRINGIDGSYMAVLSGAGDDKTNVRVGDKLPDGSTVTEITAHTVQLRGPNDKTERTLRVNNASPMSHGRRAP